MSADGAFLTDPARLSGAALRADPRTFGDAPDWREHKIAFVMPYVDGKDVLDIGCVEHDPENYQSRYWLHRALCARARSVLGMDLYADGVNRLRARGYHMVVGDAQRFRLDRQFDVIVAGDVIAHLEDLHGFLASCRRHLRPGGRILVSTPNPWHWMNLLRAALRDEACSNPEQVNWLCARTMRQLAERQGLAVRRFVFGSRRRLDRWAPLPRGWRHTSIHFEIFDPASEL